MAANRRPTRPAAKKYTDADARRFELATREIAAAPTFVEAADAILILAKKDTALQGADWTFSGMLSMLHGEAYEEWLQDYSAGMMKIAKARAVRVLADIDKMKHRDATEAAVAIMSERSSPRTHVPDTSRPEETPAAPQPLKDGASAALGIGPEETPTPAYLDEHTRFL